MNWDLRTCARRGHVVYIPDEDAPRAAVRGSGADQELWQCLRCEAFVAPGPADRVGDGPVADVPAVARGRQLRDRFVLRLLAAERLVRGVALVGLSFGAWQFRSAQAGLRQGLASFLPQAHPLAVRMGFDLEHAPVVQAAQRVLDVRPPVIAAVALGLLGYGLLQLVEGVGLWLAHRWGEYVAVVATCAFMPAEVYEVLEGASLLKVAALVLNVAIVLWLVMSKRLFGVRGGHAALVLARRGRAVLDPAAFVRPEAADDSGDAEEVPAPLLTGVERAALESSRI